MGTHFFKAQGGAAPATHPTTGLNLEARAIGAFGGAGKAAGGAAQKDLGTASGLYNAKPLKPSVRGAAYAPGPKKL